MTLLVLFNLRFLFAFNLTISFDGIDCICIYRYDTPSYKRIYAGGLDKFKNSIELCLDFVLLGRAAATRIARSSISYNRELVYAVWEEQRERRTLEGEYSETMIRRATVIMIMMRIEINECCFWCPLP
jgi:hypothetical protein